MKSSPFNFDSTPIPREVRPLREVLFEPETTEHTALFTSPADLARKLAHYNKSNYRDKPTTEALLSQILNGHCPMPEKLLADIISYISDFELANKREAIEEVTSTAQYHNSCIDFPAISPARNIEVFGYDIDHLLRISEWDLIFASPTIFERQEQLPALVHTLACGQLRKIHDALRKARPICLPGSPVNQSSPLPIKTMVHYFVDSARIAHQLWSHFQNQERYLTEEAWDAIKVHILPAPLDSLCTVTHVALNPHLPESTRVFVHVGDKLVQMSQDEVLNWRRLIFSRLDAIDRESTEYTRQTFCGNETGSAHVLEAIDLLAPPEYF